MFERILSASKIKDSLGNGWEWYAPKKRTQKQRVQNQRCTVLHAPFFGTCDSSGAPTVVDCETNQKSLDLAIC